jgi:two-component system LytT family response regulator
MTAEIDWIEAAGVYVNLHVKGKELLHRSALHELAKRLGPNRFVRIHRSTLVNIERIVCLEPISHGDFEVVLKNGARLQLSRVFRPELEKKLGQEL